MINIHEVFQVPISDVLNNDKQFKKIYSSLGKYKRTLIGLVSPSDGFILSNFSSPSRLREFKNGNWWGFQFRINPLGVEFHFELRIYKNLDQVTIDLLIDKVVRLLSKVFPIQDILIERPHNRQTVKLRRDWLVLELDSDIDRCITFVKEISDLMLPLEKKGASMRRYKKL